MHRPGLFAHLGQLRILQTCILEGRKLAKLDGGVEIKCEQESEREESDEENDEALTNGFHLQHGKHYCITQLLYWNENVFLNVFVENILHVWIFTTSESCSFTKCF